MCFCPQNSAKSHICVVTKREICWSVSELIGRQEDRIKNRFSKLENSWDDTGHKYY